MYLKPHTIQIVTWKHGNRKQSTWCENIEPGTIQREVDRAGARCRELKVSGQIDNYNVIAVPCESVRIVIQPKLERLKCTNTTWLKSLK